MALIFYLLAAGAFMGDASSAEFVAKRGESRLGASMLLSSWRQRIVLFHIFWPLGLLECLNLSFDDGSYRLALPLFFGAIFVLFYAHLVWVIRPLQKEMEALANQDGVEMTAHIERFTRRCRALILIGIPAAFLDQTNSLWLRWME